MDDLRLNRKDLRFIAVCLALLLGGLIVSVRYFHRAFPEASIDFRLNRPQSQRVADDFLRNLNLSPPADYRHAARFGYDGTAKTYLEKELGVEKAQRYLGSTVRLWYWQHRWFKPGTKEEFRVFVSPEGDVVRLAHELAEDAPGESLAEDDARTAAERFLFDVMRADSANLIFLESQRIGRAARTDWSFTYRARGVEPARGSEYRYSVSVLGDRVGEYSEYLHVPEVWKASFGRLRSYNETAGSVAGVGFLLTAIAMVAVLFIRIRRRDIRWRAALGFGFVAAALTLLNQINELPLRFYWYDTTASWPGFLFETILYGLLQPLAAGLAIFVVTAAAETLYRERNPQQLSIPRMFTPRALGTKSAFKSILLGVTLTVFFLAYQIVFYLIAGKFGAWSPSDVPYDNLLNTAMPWLAVLAIGFFPAVSEEFISRAFSISFLQKVFRNRLTWLAVLIPAIIWGFGHAGYPNQPFWIRGAEVGLAGIVIGVLMLRQGILALLVWHYTVDALYTALLLFRSDNVYFIATAAIATGLLAIPLLVSLVVYLRRGAFVPEAGLCNSDLLAPPIPPIPEVPPISQPSIEPGHTYSPLPRTGRIAAIALAAAGIVAALIPAERIGDFLKYSVPREQAIQTFADSLRRSGWCDPDTMRIAAFVFEEQDIGPNYPNTYLLKQLSSVSEFNRISDERLGTGRWRVTAFVPENRLRFSVTVHARSGQIEGFWILLPEETPGDSLSKERAQAIVESTLVARGEDMSRLELKEHREQARPARLDHTLIYEAKDGDPRHIGEARYRRSGMLTGGCLRVSARPFYKIPEEWERDRRATTSLRAAVRGLRILVIACLAVWAAFLLAMKTRRGEILWGKAFRWAILPALISAAGSLNERILEQQSYFSRIEQPWSVFQTESLTQLLVSILIFYIMTALIIALISGLYRDFLFELRVVRRQAKWDALGIVVAVIGVILLTQSLQTILHSAAPAWIPFGGWPVSDWIATPWPIFSMASSVTAQGIFAAGLLAFAAYLWTGPMRAPFRRIALLIAGVLALLPGSAVEPGEWLLASAYGLLTLLMVWLVLRFVVARRAILFLLACATAATFLSVSHGISSGNSAAMSQAWLLAIIVIVLSAAWIFLPARRSADA